MEEVKRCPMNEFKNCWGHQCRWWVEEQQNCCITIFNSKKQTKQLVMLPKQTKQLVNEAETN